MVLQIWCVVLVFESQVSEIVWQVKIVCVRQLKKTVSGLRMQMLMSSGLKLEAL